MSIAFPDPTVRRPGAAHRPRRVAVLDDHPLVRAGLEAVMARTPDLVHVGAAADEDALWPLLHRTAPDVLLVDLHRPGRDGLAITAMVAGHVDAPRVVLHAAVRSDALTVAAALAGAAAIVGKADSRLELLDAIRAAAAAPRGPAAVGPEVRGRVLALLDDDDRAVAAMRLAGTPVAGIADALGLTPREAGRRLDALLARLTGSVETGRASPAAPPRPAPRQRRRLKGA